MSSYRPLPYNHQQLPEGLILAYGGDCPPAYLLPNGKTSEGFDWTISTYLSPVFGVGGTSVKLDLHTPYSKLRRVDSLELLTKIEAIQKQCDKMGSYRLTYWSNDGLPFSTVSRYYPDKTEVLKTSFTQMLSEIVSYSDEEQKLLSLLIDHYNLEVECCFRNNTRRLKEYWRKNQVKSNGFLS